MWAHALALMCVAALAAAMMISIVGWGRSYQRSFQNVINAEQQQEQAR